MTILGCHFLAKIAAPDSEVIINLSDVAIPFLQTDLTHTHQIHAQIRNTCIYMHGILYKALYEMQKP